LKNESQKTPKEGQTKSGAGMPTGVLSYVSFRYFWLTTKVVSNGVG